MDFIRDILAVIAEALGLPVWTVPTAITLGGLAFWTATRVLGGERREDWLRGKVLAGLKRASLPNRLIRRTILRFLLFQDRLFGDNTVKSRGLGDVPLWTAIFGSRMTPWTFASYDRLLLLAFLYPLGTLCVTWWWIDESRVGNTVILPPGLTWEPSALMLGVLVGLAVWFAKPGINRWKTVLFYSFLAISAFAALAINVAGLGPGVAVTASAIVGVCCFALVGTGAVRTTFMVSGVVVILVVGDLGSASTFGAVTYILCGAAFAIVSFVVLEKVMNRVEVSERRSVKVTFCVLNGSITIYLALLAIRLGANPSFDLSPASVSLLFICILPLANAPLDWVSVGLTRALLREAWSRRTWYWGLGLSFLDLAFAVLAMAPLAFVVAFVVEMANLAAVAGGAGVLIDLPSLIDDMRSGTLPTGNTWIIAMILTTLLPTAIHLFLAGVAALSALGMLLHSAAVKAEELIERAADGHTDRLVTIGIPLLVGVVTALLVWLSGMASVHWDAPLSFVVWLGDYLLDTAEFAVWLLS